MLILSAAGLIMAAFVYNKTHRIAGSTVSLRITVKRKEFSNEVCQASHLFMYLNIVGNVSLL